MQAGALSPLPLLTRSRVVLRRASKLQWLEQSKVQVERQDGLEVWPPNSTIATYSFLWRSKQTSQRRRSSGPVGPRIRVLEVDAGTREPCLQPDEASVHVVRGCADANADL